MNIEERAKVKARILLTNCCYIEKMNIDKSQCSGFNLPFQIFTYYPMTSSNCNNFVSTVYTAVDILCWYSKNRDPSNGAGTMTVNN